MINAMKSSIANVSMELAMEAYTESDKSQPFQFYLDESRNYTNDLVKRYEPLAYQTFYEAVYDPYGVYYHFDNETNTWILPGTPSVKSADGFKLNSDRLKNTLKAKLEDLINKQDTSLRRRLPSTSWYARLNPFGGLSKAAKQHLAENSNLGKSVHSQKSPNSKLEADLAKLSRRKWLLERALINLLAAGILATFALSLFLIIDREHEAQMDRVITVGDKSYVKSTFANSTFANSTFANSTIAVAISALHNSTVANSTVANSTVANSTDSGLNSISIKEEYPVLRDAKTGYIWTYDASKKQYYRLDGNDKIYYV